MNNQQQESPGYLPRPGDLPVSKLVALANQAIADMGGPDRCQVYFTFTCQYCGARCTFNEPNSLFETGECAKCKRLTSIIMGGLSLRLKLQ